jgi:hypothetical protein
MGRRLRSREGGNRGMWHGEQSVLSYYGDLILDFPVWFGGDTDNQYLWSFHCVGCPVKVPTMKPEERV